MRSDYIYERVEKLTRKYKTRSPIELLECMNVSVAETDQFERLKGYCFLSCRTFYVRINSSLSDSEKKVVAAHELGHIVLHKQQLQLAPMKDSVLYDMSGRTEYDANLFAANLIIDDREIEKIAQDPDLDYLGVSSSLYVPPELVGFKLFSMIQRGYLYNIPMGLDSQFLAKDERHIK